MDPSHHCNSLHHLLRYHGAAETQPPLVPAQEKEIAEKKFDRQNRKAEQQFGSPQKQTFIAISLQYGEAANTRCLGSMKLKNTGFTKLIRRHKHI